MKFGIIGGDMRNKYLVKVLKKNDNNVSIYKDYGIYSIEKDVEVMSDIKEFASENDVIVASIPLTKDKENINAPYIDENININAFIKNMSNKTFISGMISDDVYKILEGNGNKVLDIMNLDSFAIYNAIATAEGTIAAMIKESLINISGSNVMICGFGKCGKILADKLKGIGAHVTVLARKLPDIAFIESYGYESMVYSKLHKSINKYDFLVNTVPELIITKELLQSMNKDVLIIDITSMPGGIDFEYAKDKNIKALHLLGIPGLVSPESSASIIYKVIERII